MSTVKDLDNRNHIVFFAKEEVDQGYMYCGEIMERIIKTYPGHKFIGLPDTIMVKELGREEIEEMIEGLQKFLDENYPLEDDKNEEQQL